MKRVYLDMCVIQRPLDLPNQIRIVLESEAVLGILTLLESNQIEIVSSDALLFETRKNPLLVRREHAMAILSKAYLQLKLSTEIEKRSAEFVEKGIHPLDALHLAFAEKAQVDYFCTCDDRLFHRAKRIADLQLKIISPIDLVYELENDISQH